MKTGWKFNLVVPVAAKFEGPDLFCCLFELY